MLVVYIDMWFGTLRAVLALDCSTPILYHIFKELHGVHDVFILESRKKTVMTICNGWHQPQLFPAIDGIFRHL